MKLKEATSFKIIDGKIQLFDSVGNKVRGEEAYWRGSFYCSYRNLTTLKGAPKEVGRHFDCSGNNLKTLEGAPKEVGGGFYCSGNNLTTLKGAPKEVGRDFYCADNNLTTLEGAPKEVGGSFHCSNNKLTTLIEAPKEVGGGFYCYSNNLTTLKGAPKEVGRDFYCSNNNLKTLVGAPKEFSKDVEERIQKALLKKRILFADGLMSKIISKKGNVYKIRIYGQKKHTFAITDGENWSHGETVRQAQNDLIFKSSTKDLSEFKNWDKAKKRSTRDLIKAYRSITGACSFGVKEFCKTIDLEKNYSVLDVIEITNDHFGNEKFSVFFEGVI
jgi:hypothetical protein